MSPPSTLVRCGLIAACAGSFLQPSLAGDLPDSTTCSAAISLIASQRYDMALALADSMIQSNPEAPTGYFIKATILDARGIDYEDDLDLTQWNQACDDAELGCRRRISAGAESADIRFILGTIYGYRSYHDFRSGNTVHAFKEGLDAVREWKRAMELDSTCWDAYLGLGTYYYHRSAKAGVLRKVGLVQDRRAEGIRLVQLAAQRGKFTRLAARSGLAWLLIEEKRFDDAEQIAKELVAEYPESRVFYWCLGRTQFNSGKWSDAAFTYETLLSLIQNDSRNNYYNEIGCLHSLAICYQKSGLTQEANAAAERALTLRPSAEIAKRKTKDINDLKRLKAETGK